MDAIFGAGRGRFVERSVSVWARQKRFTPSCRSAAGRRPDAVAAVDGKGVPLVQRDAEQVPAFEQRERPGNRHMATLGAIYSVNRQVRTADDIRAALFREEPSAPPPKRPEPVGKCLRGSFTQSCDNGDGTQVLLSGTYDACRWLREQLDKRRQPGQPIVVLIDGQESLWDAAACCFDGVVQDSPIIEILDIVHMAGYVWQPQDAGATTGHARRSSGTSSAAY